MLMCDHGRSWGIHLGRPSSPLWKTNEKKIYLYVFKIIINKIQPKDKNNAGTEVSEMLYGKHASFKVTYSLHNQ